MTPLDWILLAGYFVVLIRILCSDVRLVKFVVSFAVPVRGSSAGFLRSLTIAATARIISIYDSVTLVIIIALVVLLFLTDIAPTQLHHRPHVAGKLMDEHYGKPARIVTGVLSVALCAASSAHRRWRSEPS